MCPHEVFCPTLDCPAKGQISQGNVTSHGAKRVRYKCSVCGKPFSEQVGTPFFRA